MTRESQSGGDAVMPESDRATPAPRDVPDLAPVPGEPAAVQEALLELEDFEPAPDEEGREPPGGALPAENWDSVPGWVLPDVLSFDVGQPTLETGAGAAPQSGGIGEYREPFAGGATASPRNGGPSQGQDGDPSVPGFSGGAVGPAWAPGAGLGPSFETPVSYNVILGTPAGDRLYGTDKPDHIMGLPGSDRLYGGDKADWLQGDDGHDRIYGEAGADKIDGEEGNDRLYGQAGNDHISGGLGVDYLYGGDGADVLYGEDGSDRLYGQSGHDRLMGGDGNDTLYGGDGHDRLDGGDGNDRIYGNAGADRLLGGEGNDRLYIDADDAQIDGGDGRDTAYVQTGAGVSLDLALRNVESAYGHNGNDAFDASGLTIATRLDGKGGNDTLLGGSGNDRLYGRAGDDSLSGGTGNDYLYGHAGADNLVGGAGNDRLYIDFSDTLIDGGAGIDTAYVQTGTGVSLDLDASNLEYAYGHKGDDSLDASGLTSATRLYGKGGDDELSGGIGNDLLYGHAGDDNLAGGSGNDRLYGHAGADSLVGGEGNDRLYGGSSGDSFVFSLSFNGDASQVSGPGADRIFDFSVAGGDRLVFTDVIDVNTDTNVDLDDLLALESNDRLQVSESGSRVVLNFNGGGAITLDGMATGSIDSLQDLIDSGASVVVA